MKTEKQRFFEQSVTGLLNQGNRSVYDGKCMYRGDGGNKCAIGWCISDDAYDPSIEELPASSSKVVHALKVSGWTNQLLTENYNLLREMQYIHDRWNVPFWPTKFTGLAKKENLDYSFIENFKEKQNEQ